jgi:hypothetical protein
LLVTANWEELSFFLLKVLLFFPRTVNRGLKDPFGIEEETLLHLLTGFITWD